RFCFQAEGGIRAFHVTGVQACALPICIQTWLEMDGYVIDRVERGDHVILAIEQHQYDCILLDRGLPNATGDEILKSLRSQQQDRAEERRVGKERAAERDSTRQKSGGSE